MIERTCFHIDKEAPTPHKSGWGIYTFHFRVDSPKVREYENGIEVRACDLEHAWKQAKAWGKRDGFTVIERI